jgi:hypothetical protein
MADAGPGMIRNADHDNLALDREANLSSRTSLT